MALVLPLLIAGLFLALLPRPAAAAADNGYTGAVVDDKAEIRSGAGTGFYPVGVATRGQQVHVVEVVEGYVKIVPPKGVYSLISKAFVDAKGDGKTGVVNGDSSDAKVNAVFAAPASGDSKYLRRQTNLNKGDTVEIVGEEGSNWKIVPPKDAYVYLPPGSVRRVQAGAPVIKPEPKPEPATPPVKAVEAPRPAPAAAGGESVRPAPERTATAATRPSEGDATRVGAKPEAQKPTPAAAQPVDGNEPAVAADNPPAAKPVEAPKAKPLAPESPTLADAEARLAEAGKHPVKDQPIDELLATYHNLANDGTLSPSDRRIVNYRIGQLERNQTIQESLRLIEAARKEGTTPIRVEEPKPRVPGVFNPADYDAVGQLLASGVYNGETGPRLYRLVEPKHMRTIAYVQASGKLDPAQTLGKIVGIKGSQRYDPAIKLRVITVDQIDVLEAGTAAGEAEPPAEAEKKAATPPASQPAADSKVYTEVKPAEAEAEAPATKPEDEPTK
jgi:hypothetical protein